MLLASCRYGYPVSKDLTNVIDASIIPKDTMHINDDKIALVNGIYYLNEQPFSGYLVQELRIGEITSYSAVFEGELHGLSRSFYKNGTLHESRSYQHNLCTGEHVGFWEETGHIKFKYYYNKEKREGAQKKWYANGAPFSHFNYKNDQEEGLQRAWQKNGTLYLNYEAKNGRRYGLQKSVLCYDLKQEAIVL